MISGLIILLLSIGGFIFGIQLVFWIAVAIFEAISSILVEIFNISEDTARDITYGTGFVAIVIFVIFIFLSG